MPGNEPAVSPGSEVSGDTATGGVPAWLHVVAAWTITLLGMVLIGTLALLDKPEPQSLLVLTGVSGGIGGTLATTSRAT